MMTGMYILFLSGLMGCANRPPVVADKTTGEVVEPQEEQKYTLQISLNEKKAIPALGWELQISESSHKSQADRGAVALRIHDGKHNTETRWFFTSQGFDKAWKSIGGRIYNKEKSIYEERYLSGWQIKLDSIDTRRSNNAAQSITCTIRRAP